MWGHKSPLQLLSPEATLDTDAIGRNSGNLIFSQAAFRTLLTADTDITVSNFADLYDQADRINQDFDAVVLPFANVFRPRFQPVLERVTELVERLTIPVTVLGVGAQSDLISGFERQARIRVPVTRFVRAILERSPSIGVRGEFSQAYLNHLGYKDVDVIGCPSMFTHGPNLHIRTSSASLNTESAIAINATRAAQGGMADVVMHHHARYPNLVYVAQGIADLNLMVWGGSQVVGGETGVPQHLSHPLYRENKVRFFLDASTWIRYLGHYDFSFGTRLHGNVAALLAGTPAHVIVHDSRTRELAEYFEIPHTRSTRITSATDAAQLYEESNYAGLVDGHPARFAVYTAFLDRHGLEHIHLQPRAPSVFDARLATLALPPPVEVFTSAMPIERARRVRRNRLSDERKTATLTGRLGSIQDRLRALEGASPTRTQRRAIRAVRRRVRSLQARRA